LLFDLKAENDAVAKAQGAVLLTYQSSHIIPMAGTLWLSVAIQNAILLGAHLYPKLCREDSSRPWKKRLWWSIILRDRVLGLGLRRHIQVLPQYHDLDLDPMDENDLSDEIHASEVYNARTKRSLASILNHQCRLSLALTRVIMTVYAPNSFTQPKKTSESEFLRCLDDIKAIKSTLAAWFEQAKRDLRHPEDVHESVILFSDLSFMYY
jgi:hypothetical protein